MSTRRCRAVRGVRSALIVGVAGGMIVTGGSRLVRASESVDSQYGGFAYRLAANVAREEGGWPTRR